MRYICHECNYSPRNRSEFKKQVMLMYNDTGELNFGHRDCVMKEAKEEGENKVIEFTDDKPMYGRMIVY
jgi:hypothetical protein